MGLPPRMRRVTSCPPSLIVGNCVAPADTAACASWGSSEKTAALAAKPTACCRNSRRVEGAEAHSSSGSDSSGVIIERHWPKVLANSNLNQRHRDSVFRYDMNLFEQSRSAWRCLSLIRIHDNQFQIRD